MSNESMNKLLVQAGYLNPDDAPEYLRLLARLGSSNRSGAVSALGAFLDLSGQDEEPIINDNADDDSYCTMCGRGYKPTSEQIEKILELIEESKAKAQVNYAE